MKNHLLLTGATGFFGQYLLKGFLLREVPLVIIARGSDGESARDRIISLVSKIEAEEGRKFARPICFTGNLTEDNLGLDDHAFDWFLDNCGAVLHNAASIRFHAPDNDRSQDPWLSNLHGTANVLELCRMAEIDTFHHVSTAYVAGDRTDIVYENELDVGQNFVNDYQESKFEAEKLIRGTDFLKNKTFIRPAVVVGDSRDGYTSAPDFGLYHYIQFNWQITNGLDRDENGKGHIPLRLRWTGDELRNLVTIDWVSEMILRIVTTPEYYNKTYHLTPDKPVTSRTIMEAMMEYFNYDGLEMIGKQEIPEADMSELEKLFYQFSSTFEVYWDREPTYDRTNTNQISKDLPTPPVNKECLKLLTDYAVKNAYEVAQK